MTTSTSRSKTPVAVDGREAWIRREAARLGFDACGIASVVEPWPAAGRLAEFIAKGRHGDMVWMDSARRGHPSALWPEARSAIVLGVNYGPEADPLEALERRSTGAISVLTYPGATALTLTPCGAHSAARRLVSWCTAAFEAL